MTEDGQRDDEQRGDGEERDHHEDAAEQVGLEVVVTGNHVLAE
mgnify:CR=1 FL=1